MTDSPPKKSRTFRFFFILCCCLFLAGSGLWFTLKHGVTLSHLSLASFTAEHIHIRLDQGFIVSIQRLTLAENKTRQSITNPQELIALYTTWSHLFQEINVDQVRYRERTFGLLFKDQQLRLANEDINLRATVSLQTDLVQADISLLEIKSYPLTFSGILTFAPATTKTSLTAHFTGPLISGNLSASLDDKRVRAELSTAEFKDLAGVLRLFQIDEDVTTWIANNITADHHRINKLVFTAPLENGKPVLTAKMVTGQAVGTNAAIFFDASLPPVTTEQIHISYVNDQLSFTLDSPTYRTKDLSGSTVAITNLMGQDSHLIVNIKTKSKLDADIHNILDTYEISLPLTQQTGITDVDLQLDFDLPNFELQTSGTFKADEGEWQCNTVPFTIASATVRLNNELVILENVDLWIRSDLDAKLTGSVDTKTKRISVATEIPALEIQDGKLDINFTDPENLTFSGTINTSLLPLLLDEIPVTHYAFAGRHTPGRLAASINDKKISVILTETLRVRLRDYLLRLDLQKAGSSKRVSFPFPIMISGTKSLIHADKLTIPTKSFRAQIKGNAIEFAADLEQGKILFEADDAGMGLTATEIDALVAHEFFPFADLEGGKFNLSLNGTDKTNFEGFVEFDNVVIKDMALLNNVLSFINTIPALATFSSPGFNKEGYAVTEGVAHFTMSGKLLTLDTLRTNGVTINTETEGWIDLENDILKLSLELISLKDYSKILSKIPWAGYVILGENGSISTSLLISGKKDDPKITTNLPAEIFMLPLNMVKRTVEWPFTLFNKIKEMATEEPAEEK
jgi:hypothetical protein